ncbi:MAG: hypothetical protein Ct9H90mP30_7320 [Actinomycetota bacterium]|nr:MAG: hypothetical protein Ct9H90mP30_7320 [Actinomycetota bacterium]
MTETERQNSKPYPKKVTVFRGGQQSSIAGWSWTLDKRAAERFGSVNATITGHFLQPLLVSLLGPYWRSLKIRL